MLVIDIDSKKTIGKINSTIPLPTKGDKIIFETPTYLYIVEVLNYQYVFNFNGRVQQTEASTISCMVKTTNQTKK